MSQDYPMTQAELEGSATALMIPDYFKALRLLSAEKIIRFLDLGCGFGGVTRVVADFFNAQEVYGVDIAPVRLDKAKKRGVVGVVADLNTGKLPFKDGYFDLVTSNGVIEHLPFFDNLIIEAHRVLREGGHFVVCMPNLANYIQRISLLLGYQPSDVEISREIYVGTILCAGETPSGHIHSATINAMKQLLAHYQFKIVGVVKGDPILGGGFSKYAPIFKVIGLLCPTSLSRRIIIVARK